MTTSVLLARLIGPLLIVIAIGVLLNRQHYRAMISDFIESPALYYLSGAMAFVIGMAMIQFHNLWVFDWRVIITILGWSSLLKGTVRILQPVAGKKFAGKIMEPELSIPILAIVLVLLGGWLSFEGFRPMA